MRRANDDALKGTTLLFERSTGDQQNGNLVTNDSFVDN